MQSIYGMTVEMLENYFISINDKKFRAIQVYEALYKKRVKDIDDVPNIPTNIKNKIKEDFDTSFITIISKQESSDVNKYLFKLRDGNTVEAVLMRHDYGTSICISSQVGCNMGCKFCESGRLKKVRNLDASEMVMQILLVMEDIGDRITHIVIMGIGEPFDNYDNVMNFVRIINHPKGIGIGSRHITISTCGIVPKIYEFMKEDGQVNLAISLHAPNNSIRDNIMPINRVYKIEDVMEAIRVYIEKTNRRVTFEYILLKGLNDSAENAKELAKLIRGMNAYVNLIPYNETENLDFKRSSKDSIMRFYDILKKEKISVTIRKEFGGNIDAACGQLRANFNRKEG